MHRDQSPLQAHPVPAHVPPLSVDVDQMLDEFTRQSLRAIFHFDPDMPAVIRVEFLAERGPGLLWRIGRELLHQGLTAMSGSGEVRMWPTLPGEHPASWLLLEAPQVEVLFELPTAGLARWLDATYRIVPAEAEMADLDWDAFLRGLLDSPGAATD
ncbi:SsgA family sporulation/cell division regulator (plasmid) [Streptomyces sp. Q6]|uniref:SsgA family sporulation/cell division regulator n=1 Tax=Streptomyces citrinus TaxID=3118173 RepID=A0ACD5AQR2_9ACTN